MAAMEHPAKEEDAPCTATDGVDKVADKLAVVRLNPARDQIQQRVNEPWSVHGGDIFTTLQGRQRQGNGNGLKRNISFNEKLTEEAFVSPCLRVASLRKVVAKKPVPTIGTPPDTIEVTYLVWANPEQGPGFEVDGTNTVTSVGTEGSAGSSASSESEYIALPSRSLRLGTLCPGDKIVAIDGKLIGDTPVMAALPAARSFVLFDVRRLIRRNSEPLRLGPEMGPLPVRQVHSSGAETPRTSQTLAPPQPRLSKGVGALGEGEMSESTTHVITVVATAGNAAQLALTAEHVVTTELSLSSTGSAVDSEGSTSGAVRVGDQIVAINGRPISTGESFRQVILQMQAEVSGRRGGLKRYDGEIRCVLTLLRRSFRACAARKRSTSMLGSIGGKVRKFIDTPPTATLTAYNKVHEVASVLAKELDVLTVDEMRCSQ